MAIDEAILHALAGGQGLATLRFYQWQPPCLSLGFGQNYCKVDEAACQRLGYTIVRRPTGGRAILHADELTYSFITSSADPRVTDNIIQSYRNLSQGLLHGLRKLGAVAVQAKGGMPKNPHQRTACFDTPSHYEITVNGKKLVGSAQLRRRGMVLQHGTLPLHGDISRIFEALSYSDEEKRTLTKKLFAHATTLEMVLNRIVPFDEVAHSLHVGFAESLDIIFEEGILSDYEHSLADKFYHERYDNDVWNKKKYSIGAETRILKF